MQLDNSDLLNFFLQISTSNRSFIQLLLNHGCISYSQLCSDILKVMLVYYRTPVESTKFCTSLNSFITCYLQFVLCESKNFIPKQHVNIFNVGDFFEAMSGELSKKNFKNVSALAVVEEPNFINFVDRLMGFVNHNSLDIDFDHLRIVKNSKLFDICANVKGATSEDGLILRNQITKIERIFAVSDFETFLSPLKEDYTKSSKGYICQKKKIVHKNQLTSTVELLSESDLLSLSDESEIDESSFADDDTYDSVYDNIISRHIGSLKNLSSDSESSLNGRVSNSDSDDDDSITFLDYFSECMIGYGANLVKSNNAQCCDVFSSESDSEASETFDNSLGNKFFKVSSSSISSISELDDFELNEGFDSDSLEICDENSSPSLQKSNKDFSFVSSSLSQGNKQTYSAYFDGFINPCFEDDDDVLILENEFLRNVNDEWERSMQDVSCKPREPKKVSFLPMPSLVTIKTFEPDDDGYHFGLYLLNQVRFKNRIEEFEQIFKPYLSENHRANIYKNSFSDSKLLI